MPKVRGDDPGRTVSIVREDGAVVVHAVGEFDLANCNRLRAAVESALGEMDVIVDLSAVTFMDSSCLAILARAAAVQAEQGQSFALRDPSNIARLVLTTTGLDTLIRDD
jgi:anti-sigma B factor antagonist